MSCALENTNAIALSRYPFSTERVTSGTSVSSHTSTPKPVNSGQGRDNLAALDLDKSRVRPINNRKPINSEHANGVYPLEKLPEELRRKYPHSVPFTGTGHPDFSRYA